MKWKKRLTCSTSKSLRLACTIAKFAILNALIVLCAGCCKNSCAFEPKIVYFPPDCLLKTFATPFPELDSDELNADWGKELYIGLQFAKEQDYYRAITCYKRALFLCPNQYKIECEYRLLEAYYFARKYEEAIHIYETGSLGNLPLDFPALRELLVMLEDSYQNIGLPEKAFKIRCLMQKNYPDTYEQVEEYEAVLNADFCAFPNFYEKDPNLCCFLNDYLSETKSPEKARLYNALLPGAGYLYVGQAKSAMTSFIINALFSWAAYRFFDRGYPAAGIITTSLELGWYFGGINGAGLAAEEWNERIYECKAKEFLIEQKLFPILQFNYAF
jgi:tetratricopeptide (TPR) repeat protein